MHASMSGLPLPGVPSGCNRGMAADQAKAVLMTQLPALWQAEPTLMHRKELFWKRASRGHIQLAHATTFSVHAASNADLLGEVLILTSPLLDQLLHACALGFDSRSKPQSHTRGLRHPDKPLAGCLACCQLCNPWQLLYVTQLMAYAASQPAK